MRRRTSWVKGWGGLCRLVQAEGKKEPQPWGTREGLGVVQAAGKLGLQRWGTGGDGIGGGLGVVQAVGKKRPQHWGTGGEGKEARR